MPVRPDPTEHAMSATLRATGAWARADARLADAIVDLFLPDTSRLDDRVRSMVTTTLAALVAQIETDLRRHAARVLVGRGDPARAEAMLGRGDVFARLARAGLLRDVDLIDELLARVRTDLMADALPGTAAASDVPGLLVRLTVVPDTVVAKSASALLGAQNRRRSATDTDTIESAALPAEIQHRLVWRIAAALRDADDPHTDQAIAQAALRSLAAYDEGDRPESVAMRLAIAIDARPAERAPLLLETLGDRNLTLFAAVLAHALAMDHDQLRAMIVDPEGERLWLALRALALDRATIAEIALALSEADPRRDIEAFADRLDAVADVPPDEAAAALAPFALDRDFRAAMTALARCERR
jgi:hypothetical protein